MAYVLHMALLPDDSGGPIIEIENLGLTAVPGKVREDNQIFHLVTEGDLDYTVWIQIGSFETWGKWSLDSLHLTTELTRPPGPREVGHIREALEKVVVGRLCDWFLLTNEENWKQVDCVYLFHATERWPVQYWLESQGSET